MVLPAGKATEINQKVSDRMTEEEVARDEREALETEIIEEVVNVQVLVKEEKDRAIIEETERRVSVQVTEEEVARDEREALETETIEEVANVQVQEKEEKDRAIIEEIVVKVSDRMTEEEAEIEEKEVSKTDRKDEKQQAITWETKTDQIINQEKEGILQAIKEKK